VNFQLAMLDDLEVNDHAKLPQDGNPREEAGLPWELPGGLAGLVGVRGSGFHVGKCMFGDAMKLDGIC